MNEIEKPMTLKQLYETLSKLEVETTYRQKRIENFDQIYITIFEYLTENVKFGFYDVEIAEGYRGAISTQNLKECMHISYCSALWSWSKNITIHAFFENETKVGTDVVLEWLKKLHFSFAENQLIVEDELNSYFSDPTIRGRPEDKLKIALKVERLNLLCYSNRMKILLTPFSVQGEKSPETVSENLFNKFKENQI